tara:strand:- start:216 stop:1310 length:1095 start_codon:yes stop_codon:yes gene_type:complete
MTSEFRMDRRHLLQAAAAASLTLPTGCATAAGGPQAAAQPMQSTRIPTEPWLIDVHQHPIPKLYIDALRAAGLEDAGGVPFPKWDAQSALDFMDQTLIRKAYPSISTPGVHFGDDAVARSLARAVNEHAATLTQAHPDRFGGFASLPLPDVEGSLREAEYALDVLKLDGVVLLTSQSDGSYVGDPKYHALMDELNRRKAVVFVHPTVPVTSKDIQTGVPGFIGEFVFDTTRAILNLVWAGTAHRCPDIKFIFSHAGGTLPYLTWRAITMDRYPQKEQNFPLGSLEYFKRFYYDLALSTAPYVMASILELMPREHLFFGSDYCFAGPDRVAIVKDMFDRSTHLSDEDRLVIGRENAMGLLPTARL